MIKLSSTRTRRLLGLWILRILQDLVDLEPGVDEADDVHDAVHLPHDRRFAVSALEVGVVTGSSADTLSGGCRPWAPPGYRSYISRQRLEGSGNGGSDGIPLTVSRARFCKSIVKFGYRGHPGASLK